MSEIMGLSNSFGGVAEPLTSKEDEAVTSHREVKTIIPSWEEQFNLAKSQLGEADKCLKEEDHIGCVTGCEMASCSLMLALLGKSGFAVPVKYMEDSAELFEFVIGDTKYDINKLADTLSEITYYAYNTEVAKTGSAKSLQKINLVFSHISAILEETKGE